MRHAETQKVSQSLTINLTTAKRQDPMVIDPKIDFILNLMLPGVFVQFGSYNLSGW